VSNEKAHHGIGGGSMNSAMFLRILARRWYIVAIGVLLAAVAFVGMQRGGGAFAVETNVVFVAPGNQGIGDVNDGNQPSLVGFAAVIERKIHDGRESDRVGENASLYGAGVDRGIQVLLVNSGSQWTTSFAKPVLSIRVVGPTREWVLSHLEGTITEIRTLAAREQGTVGVASTAEISTERVPEVAEAHYIGSTRGTQLRALAALLLVGFGLSSATAVALDRSLAGRTVRGFAAAASHRVIRPIVRRRKGTSP
jgi:hypothetical protein